MLSDTVDGFALVQLGVAALEVGPRDKGNGQRSNARCQVDAKCRVVVRCASVQVGAPDCSARVSRVILIFSKKKRSSLFGVLASELMTAYAAALFCFGSFKVAEIQERTTMPAA